MVQSGSNANMKDAPNMHEVWWGFDETWCYGINYLDLKGTQETQGELKRKTNLW